MDNLVKDKAIDEASQSEDNLPQGYREAPSNLHIEMAVLGSILRNNKALESLDYQIEAKHFWSREHQIIFTHIQNVIKHGQVASPASMAHIIDADHELNEIGGSKYLFNLVTKLMSVVNFQQYCQNLIDLYMRRELIGVGERVVNTAYDPGEIDYTANKQIAAVEEELYQLASDGQLEHKALELNEATAAALERITKAKERGSKLVGVTSGFRKIDKTMGGFHPSDLIILAGRPGMGKTSLAINFAFNAAMAYRNDEDDAGNVIEEGAQTLFFSLEMSAEQLASRILSQVANIPGSAIRSGELSDADIANISFHAQAIQNIPLTIDDSPSLTMEVIRQKARRHKRRHGLGLIVIDYLQLIDSPSHRRAENRVQEVSQITKSLKALARELNVPVIALSQLSRMVEQREDKRPKLSDLRESGSIEQDADIVSFIFREYYYLKTKKMERREFESEEKFQQRLSKHEERKDKVINLAEFIIEKQRHGSTGIIKLTFDHETTSFSNHILSENQE